MKTLEMTYRYTQYKRNSGKLTVVVSAYMMNELVKIDSPEMH
jgi:hypothetical protein